MNQINRLCLRNQQIINITNEIGAELITLKSATPVLGLQSRLANLLSSAANLLAFKELVFYPYQKKYIAVKQEYDVVDNFTKQLSLTHKSVSAYRLQWSNYYHIRDNHDKCLEETKSILSSIKNLAQYEIDYIAPILGNKEMTLTPVNYLDSILTPSEAIN